MASTIEILRTKDALDLWSLLPAAAGVEEATKSSEALFIAHNASGTVYVSHRFTK